MWIIAAAWLIALFLLLPGLIAIPVALNDSRFIALPHGSLSLRHFDALLGNSAWLASMGQSALIAFAATLLALTIGTACAVGLWRLGGRSAAAIAAIVLAPLILPPIVSALSLYRVWVAVGLYDTWLGVVIAHTVIGEVEAAVGVEHQVVGCPEGSAVALGVEIGHGAGGEINPLDPPADVP